MQLQNKVPIIHTALTLQNVTGGIRHYLLIPVSHLIASCDDPFKTSISYR